VWTAPFLVGEDSALAAEHPDWLARGADAGWNWDQRLHVLDVTNPAAAGYLERIFRTFSEWGVDYFKLDFLYAGAIAGGRHADCSPHDAYREGLRLIRRAVGEDAILLACGAPLLTSIGLVDAMRVGPDVLAENTAAPIDRHLANVRQGTSARSWMHGRLWVNDPDCLVVRPGITGREEWASHVEACRGLAFSSDRLAGLDDDGVELTRGALRPSSTGPVGLDPFPL
jgi:alpha-galactosidase